MSYFEYIKIVTYNYLFEQVTYYKNAFIKAYNTLTILLLFINKKGYCVRIYRNGNKRAFVT